MFEETVSVVSIWASMGSWLTPTVLFVVLNVMIGTIAVTSGFGNKDHQNNKSDNNKDHHSETHNHDYQTHQQYTQYSPIQPQLSRSPSVLQRLKSINFTSFRFQHYQQPPTAAVTPDPVQYTAPVEKVYPDLDSRLEEFLTQNTENRNELEAARVEEYPIREEFKPVVEEEEDEVEGEEMTMDQIYSQIQMMSRSKSENGGRKIEKLPKKIVKKAASDASAFKHFVPEDEEEEDVLRVERRRPAIVREERREVHPDEEVDAKADDFINKFKEMLKLQKQESILMAK